MKANETKCLPFLKGVAQFQIPIYQRAYSWTERQCRQLWDDVLRAGADPKIDSHFVGSVVYVHDGLHTQSEVPRLLVIDGQQRLTTLSLFILALADEAEQRSSELKAELRPDRFRQYHLTNHLEDGDRRHKLLLTYGDRDTLFRLVDGDPVEAAGFSPSPRIMENLSAFSGWASEASDNQLRHLWSGLAKLMMIDVSLDRQHDDPQLIFESLNSTGLALSQADLIRNHVLMGLEPTAQRDLYEKHWRPMEAAFGPDAYAAHFDGFVRHFLTRRTRQISRQREIYRAFKAYAKGRDVAEVVADLHHYAGHYVRIAGITAPGGAAPETHAKLRRAFAHLRTLKTDTTVPFFLEVMNDRSAGLISDDDALYIVRLIESYVFRRLLCDVPPNTHNKTFASLATRITKTDRASYIESIAAALLHLPGSRRLPDDVELSQKLSVKDVYSLRNRDYLLEKLENHRRKEPFRVSDYTIEHVLPQNPKLSPAWQESLGAEWKDEQKRLLHTLGNLTLTAYNSELSDRPFVDKRDHEGGFAGSPLWLNRSLAKLDRWDVDAVEKRTRTLAERARDVWPLPQLDDATLAKFAPAVDDPKRVYTLDDFPKLTGEVRSLFDILEEAVTQVDERIERRVAKQYIAFRLDRALLSIVPQNSCLKIYLTAPPSELNDPERRIKDVSGRGHWGTGDAMLQLRRQADLEPAMNLIKQTYQYHLSHKTL